MPTPPANPDALSGAVPVNSAEATGAELADVMPAAGVSLKQEDADALARAFLGADPTPQADETLPEEQEPNAEAEAEATAEISTPDNPAESDDHPQSKLDHLIDKLAKDPENKDIRKRIAKILDESPRLKSQLAEAQKKLEASALPVVVAPPTATDPLSDIGSMTDLQETLQRAEQWEAWCEDHPEGGNTNPKDDKTYLSPEEVKAQLRQARSVLRAAPQRAEWIKKLEATRETLRASAPELFQKDSPLLTEAIALVKEGRISSRNPDYMLDALDLIEGRRIRQEREKGITRVKLAPAKPQAASGSTASASQRPAPTSGAVTKAPATRPASAGADIAALSTSASKGNQKAADELARAFLTTQKDRAA